MNGLPNSWLKMEGFASASAAYCVVFTIYFLVINWIQVKKQNDELKTQTVDLQNQTKDMKRATDAQVFKTVLDILQAQDIRDSRKWVLENIFDNPLKRNELTRWNPKDIAEAEKVSHTFDSCAMFVHEGILPKQLLIEWGDPIMKCWASVRCLADSYVEMRGQKDPFPHFRQIAMEYIKQEYEILSKMKMEENNQIAISRAKRVALCLELVKMKNESDQIKSAFNL